MGINRSGTNLAYGFNNALQGLAPSVIFAERDPETTDRAQLGSMWINTDVNTYFVLTSANTWTAQAAGSTTVASLDITGTSGDVLTVATGGDTVLGGDLSVSGATEFTGTVLMNDTVTINGSVDIDSNTLISITSTLNTAPSIQIAADGGASEAIVIVSNQGTGGGADIIPSVFLGSLAGGISVSAAKDIRIESSSTGTVAMNLLSAGNINLTAARNLQLKSTRDFSGSVSITANGGTSESIIIQASQGTSNSSVVLNSVAGGVSISALTGVGIDSIGVVAIGVSSAGNVAIKSNVETVAGTSMTNDSFFGTCIFTGQTITVGNLLGFTINNTNVTTSLAVNYSVSFVDTSSSNGLAIAYGTVQSAGSITIYVKNVGSGDITSADNIIIGFQVLL